MGSVTIPAGSYSKSELQEMHPSPYVATITTGQWSGSGSDRYITVSASNVTADSILIPTYDADSESRLNGPVWCVPAAGSFTIHTTAIPSNTVTIIVQFVGTLGTAQYQVLSDVYSKSQTDALIAQSTAKEIITPTLAQGMTASELRVRKSGQIVVINGSVILGSTALAGMDGVLFTLPTGCRPSEYVSFYCEATYNGNLGNYYFRAAPNGEVESATGGGTYGAGTVVKFNSVVFVV